MPPGSILTAMAMTSIYPLENAGRWRPIGATPIELFDFNGRERERAQLNPGDAARFDPMTTKINVEIQTAVAGGGSVLPRESVLQ